MSDPNGYTACWKRKGKEGTETYTQSFGHFDRQLTENEIKKLNPSGKYEYVVYDDSDIMDLIRSDQNPAKIKGYIK